ncbi:GH14484 [Drosophila grimshawi]|uniref:GH14484 n=1 Tax=Drosophila grimshawi TaxID=7222 RepID=B4J022_DROGR|nr:GH14484 [Drosophila grimshawi]
MSSLNIFDLNDDCLDLLLNYLTSEEQILFAQVCKRFREVFIAWGVKHYREFGIDASNTKQSIIGLSTCREVVETLIIDMDHFDTARIFRNYGCDEPVICFNILCYALSGMVNLRRLTVKQLDYVTTPIKKPFEQIFASVKDLNDLKVLEVHAKDDWTFDTLWQLHHLEELQLQIQKIYGEVLVECCKSNPNLRRLQLGYGIVVGNLCDIVRHCANLETLEFGMMETDFAYKPLSRVPRLRQLIHKGARESNSLMPLLKALAVQPQLQQLHIDGGILTPQEILQIVRQRGLLQLKCFCSTAECVEMLAQLIQLQKLSIWVSNGCDISDALLKVIGQCKKLQLLRIASGNLKPDFIYNVSKLLLDLRTDTPQESLHLELPPSNYTKSIEVRS